MATEDKTVTQEEQDLFRREMSKMLLGLGARPVYAAEWADHTLETKFGPLVLTVGLNLGQHALGVVYSRFLRVSRAACEVGASEKSGKWSHWYFAADEPCSVEAAVADLKAKLLPLLPQEFTVLPREWVPNPAAETTSRYEYAIGYGKPDSYYTASNFTPCLREVLNTIPDPDLGDACLLRSIPNCSTEILYRWASDRWQLQQDSEQPAQPVLLGDEA